MHNIVKSQYFARAGQLFAASALTALLAACANSPMPAPVVDRTSTSGTTAATLEPAPPDTIGSSEVIPFTVSRWRTASRIAMWQRGTI